MVHSLGDITSTGALAALSQTSIRAVWVQIQSKTGNSASNARVGDSLITSTRGAILVPGTAQFFPTCGNANTYDLSTIYILGQSNDVFEVIYHTD
jgi:hypothetical protein